MSFENKPRDLLVNQSNLSDYEWLAFQYLSDELTSQQRDSFEETLLTDPAAAEALQAMVAVTQQLLAAGNTTAEQTNTGSVERAESRESSAAETPAVKLRWLAALAAGLLLLIGGSQLLAPRFSDIKLVNDEADTSGDQMAELWASSFEEELALAGERDESQYSTSKETEFAISNPAEETTESDLAEEDWLYSVLVSLESTEDWPTEEQGGS